MPGALRNHIPLTKKKPSSIHVAVIETSLQVKGHLVTAFHIMLEDATNHYSLVRYIQDFKELDLLVIKYFPKQRIPLPKLANLSNTSKKRSLFSLKKKSNTELLEQYLHRCIHGLIGSSSLFRDFLSAQRDEDRIISKVTVRQLVAQHVVQASSPEQHQDPLLMTPPHTLKRKRANTSCQQLSHSDVTLPPSPPSSISITSIPLIKKQLHAYNYDNESTPHSYNMLNLIMCDSDSEDESSIENHKTVNDYQLIKVLGQGAAGKVILVREHTSRNLYALKAINKSWNITKREVDNLKMERDILATLSQIYHPFIIKLQSAFQDQQNLYLVLEYHAGADLATLLQRYINFPAEQCRLYAAEILMGLQELHRHHILYRDLKPENVLLAADGHIVLTDFGLSKMFEGEDKYEHRTMSFCGTPEYLAPEIIQQDEYSYAADYWSLGTMMYEMITGVTPFIAETVQEMYTRIVYGDLIFPYGFDPEAMDIIAGLLERDPLDRLGAGFGGVFELRTHSYFSGHLDWKDVHAKRIKPYYVPSRSSETDLSNFDPEFLNMSTHLKEENDQAIILRQKWLPDTCPAGLAKDAFRGFSFADKNTNLDMPYESELSFFSDEYMLYDEEEDEDEYICSTDVNYKANNIPSLSHKPFKLQC